MIPVKIIKIIPIICLLSTVLTTKMLVGDGAIDFVAVKDANNLVFAPFARTSFAARSFELSKPSPDLPNPSHQYYLKIGGSFVCVQSGEVSDLLVICEPGKKPPLWSTNEGPEGQPKAPFLTLSMTSAYGEVLCLSHDKLNKKLNLGFCIPGDQQQQFLVKENVITDKDMRKNLDNSDENDAFLKGEREKEEKDRQKRQRHDDEERKEKDKRAVEAAEKDAREKNAKMGKESEEKRKKDEREREARVLAEKEAREDLERRRIKAGDSSIPEDENGGSRSFGEAPSDESGYTGQRSTGPERPTGNPMKRPEPVPIESKPEDDSSFESHKGKKRELKKGNTLGGDKVMYLECVDKQNEDCVEKNDECCCEFESKIPVNFCTEDFDALRF